MAHHTKRPRTESTSYAENSDDDLFDIRPLQLPSIMTENISNPTGASSSRLPSHVQSTPAMVGSSLGLGALPQPSKPIEPMDLADDSPDTHVTQLMRHWMNERLSPDILQHCGDLLQTLLHRIREQATLVFQLRGDSDANEDEHYQIILVQTEMERIRFVIRSYTRTRIAKIEKYAKFILQNLEVQRRLSMMELRYLQTYERLLENHFHTTVLKDLPPWIRIERDGSNWPGPSTVSKPSYDMPVFVRALQDCDHILLPDGRPIDLKNGTISLLRYSSVANCVLRGEVELI